MFRRLVAECRLAVEDDVYTGGKKKHFFKDTELKHHSATPEMFKWASRRKNLSGELRVHAPHKRKRGSGNDEKGDS